MTHRRTKSDHPTAKESAELATLKTQLAELTAGWQRTQADFENFRRRTAADQADRTATEVGRTLLHLTPIAENLRRALEQLATMQQPTAEQLAAWAKGIGSIARQFDQGLAGAGLIAIHPTEGERFDPGQHEALAHQPHATVPAEAIVATVERGYRTQQRILVPAKVIVSAGPATA